MQEFLSWILFSTHFDNTDFWVLVSCNSFRVIKVQFSEYIGEAVRKIINWHLVDLFMETEVFSMSFTNKKAQWDTNGYI